jgi:hypothetical protein
MKRKLSKSEAKKTVFAPLIFTLRVMYNCTMYNYLCVCVCIFALFLNTEITLKHITYDFVINNI